jgi:micrococcal nuclease
MFPRAPINRVFSLVMSLFLLVPTLAFANEFKVVKVYDGNTIKVEGYGTSLKVRLAGIDAPELCAEKTELGQPFGEEAKDYLSGLILDKTVGIKGYGQKRYALMWGTILLGDKDINLEMVQAGYAEVYRGKSPKGLTLEPLFQAEKEAMAAKRGIWSQGEGYVTPRDWRKTQKVRSGCAVLLYGICGQKVK